MAGEISDEVKSALMNSPEIKKVIQLKDGQIITYRALLDLREQEQENVLASAIKRSEKINFNEWILQATNARIAEMDKQHEAQLARIAVMDKQHEAQLARIAEMDKNIAAKNAENAEKRKQLVQKYTLYIGNAEILGKGSKRIFNDIINFNDSPEALKQRTRALLADKNMKWED